MENKPTDTINQRERTKARKAERKGNVTRVETYATPTGKEIPYVNHDKQAKRKAELQTNRDEKETYQLILKESLSV